MVELRIFFTVYAIIAISTPKRIFKFNGKKTNGKPNRKRRRSVQSEQDIIS
jgi:hypothetical protein